MNEQKFEVIEAWAVVYKNPIKLKKADEVRVEKRESDPEWAGWIYCVNSEGVGGWVSETYLKIEGFKAIVTHDYDATELEVRAGEIIQVSHEEFGWGWATNDKGCQGWVPLRCLKAVL